VTENDPVSSSQKPHDQSAGDARARREPPTIDLDAADVSGDTNASWSRRAGRIGDRIRASMAPGAGYLVPAAVAGLVAAVVSAGFWLTDFSKTETPSAPPAASSVADLATRLSRIEARIDNPPAPAKAAPDPETVARLSASEQTLQSLRESLASMRRQIDALTSTLAELKSAPREGGAANDAVAVPDLGPLQERVALIEQAVTALKQEAAGRSAAPSAERPMRRLAVATLLDSAVRQGQSFADELAAARALADEPDRLAPLEPFAANGVPSDSVKCRELLALLPRLRPPAEPAPSGGGMTEKFWANATRLVRVRPAVDGGDGASASDALTGQIEKAAQRNDLPQALQLIARLPEPARALAADFVASVALRDTAITSSRKFVIAALAAIGNPAR
jgi:hypothetical protein